MGIAASHGRRRHRGEPHRRHRQADPLRLGGARRRHRRGAGRARASPARRPCSRAGSASSPRTSTAGTTPTRCSATSARAGSCCAPSTSRTRPTTSPTPASTARSRCAPRGLDPADDRVGSSWACAAPVLRTIAEPREEKIRPRSRVPREVLRPVHGRAGRCSAAAGSGSTSTTSPTRRTPTPRALGAGREGPLRRRRAGQRASSRARSPPCCGCAPPTGSCSSTGSTPPAAARSTRCRAPTCWCKFRLNAGRALPPAQIAALRDAVLGATGAGVTPSALLALTAPAR